MSQPINKVIKELPPESELKQIMNATKGDFTLVNGQLAQLNSEGKIRYFIRHRFKMPQRGSCRPQERHK